MCGLISSATKRHARRNFFNPAWPPDASERTMSEKRQSIHQRLTAVFRDVFDDEAIVLTNATTAADIAEWDSLMHISLVVAIEKEFQVRLNASEVGKLQHVGQMIDLLEERAR